MSNSNTKWSADGQYIETIPPHTKKKHELTEKYVTDLIYTLYSKGRYGINTFTFIDGFCGGGIYHDPESNDKWYGSPIRLINAVKKGYLKSKRQYPLDVKFIFIDSNKNHLNCLKNVAFVENGFEQLLDQEKHIVETFKEGNLTVQCEFIFDKFENQVNYCVFQAEQRKGHSLFFLDPYGYLHVSMESFRKINSLGKSEIIYTLMSRDIERFVFDKKRKEREHFYQMFEAEEYFKNIDNLYGFGREAEFRDKSMMLFKQKGNAIQKSALNKKSLCDYVVNIASGCLHGCTFCYVPSTPSIRTQQKKLHKKGVENPQLDWGKYLFVREGIPEKLDQILTRKRTWEKTPSGKGVVLLCSGTDPYQNKQIAKITRQTIEVLLKHNKKIRILTRGLLWQNDLDILVNPNITLGMSIPCINDELLKKIEINAPLSSDRYKALEKGYKANCRLYIAMAPTPPLMTLDDFRFNLEKTRFFNRVCWASIYLKKAELVESTRRGYSKITQSGIDLLKTNPIKIDIKFLEKYPSFQEFRKLKGTRKKKNNDDLDNLEQHDNSITPAEALEEAYQTLRDELADEILAKVKSINPYFFERLVVELLVKMGYGGSKIDAGKAIGKSGDGGIDGIIKEDRLGLDVIYIQAKRWSENAVSRPQVQQFAGALAGQKANKGIFITTSRFTQEARDYVKQIGSKIVLIDGEELAQLMIDSDVGVATSTVYCVKKIDSDYFDQ